MTPESDNKHQPRSSFEDIGRRMDDEIEELIRWFNNDVVPHVRKHSSQTLRKAASKLADFADHMDDVQRKP